MEKMGYQKCILMVFIYDIVINHLNNFIEIKKPESKTIEYKRELNIYTGSS